jgi:hypothetical protein
MGFTGTIRTMKLNTARFRRELASELREALTASTTAWLNAAIRTIPVWSGAARATFKPLAQTVNFQVLNNPRSSAPDRRAQGASQGTGELDIDVKAGKYGFRYSTDLAHLIFNEFNADASGDPNAFSPKSIGGLPYGFQGAALQAWQQVADQVRLPIPRLQVKRNITIR